MGTDSALLIIDMQVALVDGAYLACEVRERIAVLLAQARTSGILVIFIQHDHAHYPPMKPGTPGWQIHPALAPSEGERVIRKQASDAFYETTLRRELDASGIKRIVVTGMQTEYCVDTTCRRALSEGYDVTLAADGHTTGDTDILSAEEIIAHHNTTLGHLAHPDHTITVKPSAEITL